MLFVYLNHKEIRSMETLYFIYDAEHGHTLKQNHPNQPACSNDVNKMKAVIETCKTGNSFKGSILELRSINVADTKVVSITEI